MYVTYLPAAPVKIPGRPVVTVSYVLDGCPEVGGTLLVGRGGRKKGLETDVLYDTPGVVSGVSGAGAGVAVSGTSGPVVSGTPGICVTVAGAVAGQTQVDEFPGT